MNTLLRLAPVLSELGEVMRCRLHRFIRRAVWITALGALAFIAGFFGIAAGLWALYLVLLAEMSAPAAAAIIALGLLAVSAVLVALIPRTLSARARPVRAGLEVDRRRHAAVDTESATASSIFGALAIGVLTGYLNGRKND